MTRLPGEPRLSRVFVPGDLSGVLIIFGQRRLGRHRPLDRIITESVLASSWAFQVRPNSEMKQKQEELSRVRRKVHQGDSGRSSEDDTIDVLAEPNLMLPLWKRVVKHFWWNEWMVQPFIEAGVSTMLS